MFTDIAEAPMDSTDVKILSYIEQDFWESGSLPTNRKVADVLGISETLVATAWKKNQFKEAINNRGITTRATDAPNLSPKQIMTVNILLDVHNRASLRAKLKAVGVSTSQYNGWLRDPVFMKYFRTRCEHLFRGNDSLAYQSLLEQVLGGDVSAIKFYFELTGVYNPRVQVDVNITGLLGQVLEIIARHCSQEVLMDIAAEFDALVTRPNSIPQAVQAALPVGLSEIEEIPAIIDVPEAVEVKVEEEKPKVKIDKKSNNPILQLGF